MTKRRVFVTVTMVVVAVLLAAAIAAAGGVAGYVIARRSLARGVPWRVHQHERQLLPPFLQPPPAIGREFTILTSGAQVTWVEKGSPAGEAGIKAGDIITAVDDQGIDGDHPLRDLISGHESGEKVTLTLNRGGKAKRSS